MLFLPQFKLLFYKISQEKLWSNNTMHKQNKLYHRNVEMPSMHTNLWVWMSGVRGCRIAGSLLHRRRCQTAVEMEQCLPPCHAREFLAEVAVK